MTRPDPMSEQSAEAALLFLVNTASRAGKAKADMIYTENWIKVVLARLKKQSAARSDAAAETEARAHPDYAQALQAHREAVEIYETLFWKRLGAEATIEAWRSRGAQQRGAGRI